MVEHSAAVAVEVAAVVVVGNLAAAAAPVAAAVGAVADTLGIAVAAAESWVHHRSQELGPRRATNFVTAERE